MIYYAHICLIGQGAEATARPEGLGRNGTGGQVMSVGFIDLGRNLLKSGEELVVFDLRAEAARPLANEGAAVASSVADRAHEASVIFTSLPGPAQVEEVVFGSGGIAESLRPGLTLFDLSTSSLSLARRVHETFRRGGASMLDAPVSGGPAGTAAGDLVLWAGGNCDEAGP